MKARNVVLLLSLSLTAAGTLVPQDQPAEKVYKNIQVLKGTPSGEVIPAMGFMAASLKVECSFCHTSDFASDEKREKQTTRKMIEMQREINARNFEGRNQVTCNTCHQGHEEPIRTPVIMDISRRSPKKEGPAVKVEDVLKKYQAAIGGNLQAVAFEGTTSLNAPTPQPFKLIQAAPNRFLVDWAGMKMGSNGVVTWMGPEILQGGQAREIEAFGRFFRGEHAFDSLGQLFYMGRDKINGKEVVVLRSGAQRASTSEDLYFDAKSGLLLRVATYANTILGVLPTVVDYSDYKSVGGTKVPMKVTFIFAQQSGAMVFTKATPNPAVDDATFSPPK